VSPDVVRAMPLDLFFDYLAVRLHGARAEGHALAINWVLADSGERYALTLANCALTYRADRQHPTPDATVTLARAALDRLVLREVTLEEALRSGAARVEGARAALARLFALLDDFSLLFPVVEARRDAAAPRLDSAPPRP
jgi:alkyl sulfatase BDS1-like metallo-beta-lactamase superfamily hydrolase